LSSKKIQLVKLDNFLGVGILGYRRPDNESVDIFSFLNVFSIGLWMCLLVAFIVTTICFFLIARFVINRMFACCDKIND